MNRITLVILFLLVTYRIDCQQTDHRISGDYNNIPFTTFTRSVEEETGLSFFFLEEWVSGVTVIARGTDLNLEEILAKSLTSHQLSFYIDRGNNIYIIPGPIIDIGDRSQEDWPDNRIDPQQHSSRLSKEEQYFGGKKEQVIEKISVGDENPKRPGIPTNLYGKIWDRENGESLIGVTIYFTETEKGTVTDVDGRYQTVIPAGKYTVAVNCLGMKEIIYELDVKGDGRLDIAMEKEIIPINEVIIRAEKNQNVSGIQMGYAKINMKSIKEIPLIMGEKDVLKVAQMLPGIQSVGEGASGFNVRGSSADQNMFYINKIPVYNTSHLFGFFSAFSPDIIKDFSLYKSNIPAEFGGRMASLFNISTREGNKNRYTAKGGISPITGHVAVEGPIDKGKHSFILGARSTYSDWILERIGDPKLRRSSASFYDLSGGLTLEPNKKNLIKFFGYYTSDHFNYNKILDYDYTNSGVSLNWRRRISSGLTSDFALISSKYDFNTVNQENIFLAYSHGYQINHKEIRLDFSWVPARKHVISFGGNTIIYDLDRGNVNRFGNSSTRKHVNLGQDKGNESALYIGDRYDITNDLSLYGGIRYSLFRYMGPAVVYNYLPGMPKEEDNISEDTPYSAGEPVKTYSGPDYRLALNYQTGKYSAVKLSYNRIRQYLFMLSNTIAISPTDQWKLCDYHIRPPYGDQLSAGYYKDFPLGGIRTSTEIYYKKLHDIIEYKDGANFIGPSHIEQEILQGNQNAYGIELMLEKDKGKFNGWIAYTYSRSRIQVDGKHTWDRINNGLIYPANYDIPHSLNTVMNYRLNRRLSLSGNFVYKTGRPVTYPLSIYYLEGQEIVSYSRRNAYRLPDYFRMDLSVNLEGNLKSKKHIHSFWMINIYNLTGRKNAYSVYFKSESGKIKGYQLSIFGSTITTISWNFKFGNYASE